MVSDLELAEKVHEFLRVSNLKKTTNNIVIKALESHFGVDLSHKKPFLRNQVDRFLQNQYNYSEEYELDFAIDRHHHGNDGVSDSGDDGGDFSADVQADNGSSSFKNIAKFQRKNKLKNKRECESGKVCTLSPQLQKFLGVVHMSRTEVLKHLWTYVRAKNLQDPMDEKTIICDETLRELFSVDSINNLQINKALTKHILRSVAEQPSSPEVAAEDEVIQLGGDEITEVFMEPPVMEIESAPIPDEVSVDPTPVSAPQAEFQVEDIPVTDSGMNDVPGSLAVIQTEETVAESPSVGLPQTLVSGPVTEAVDLTSPVSNLAGEVTLATDMGPPEGPSISRKRFAEHPLQDAPLASKQKEDEGITSQHSGSFDFMNSVSRFLAFRPVSHHNFHKRSQRREKGHGRKKEKLHSKWTQMEHVERKCIRVFLLLFRSLKILLNSWVPEKVH